MDSLRKICNKVLYLDFTLLFVAKRSNLPGLQGRGLAVTRCNSIFVKAEKSLSSDYSIMHVETWRAPDSSNEIIRCSIVHNREAKLTGILFMCLGTH